MQEPDVPYYALLEVAASLQKVGCRLVLVWILRQEVIGTGHNLPLINRKDGLVITTAL